MTRQLAMQVKHNDTKKFQTSYQPKYGQCIIVSNYTASGEIRFFVVFGQWMPEIDKNIKLIDKPLYEFI